ncbi:type I polyketide synthase [Pseudomonas syringae]|uniref:type I polyketide synthase n=1 Tax=Pseudomonas syringae TaxID=317 RepID=UPI000CD37104|nr:type I polyketide synthase [Pseudomonas syringae]SOQ02979.1 beta-ketoacyl synthase [Pseudomonas syringae pv. syringae]
MNNSNEVANFQRYIIDQLKAGRITKEQAVQALAKTDATGGSMREEQSGPPGSTRYVPVWRDAPLGRALDVAQAHEQHCVVVVTEHGHERLVDTLKARLDQRLLARMTVVSAPEEAAAKGTLADQMSGLASAMILDVFLSLKAQVTAILQHGKGRKSSADTLLQVFFLRPDSYAEDKVAHESVYVGVEAAISAMLKTLNKEHPSITTQLVALDEASLGQLSQNSLAEEQHSHAAYVRYLKNVRYVQVFETLSDRSDGASLQSFIKTDASYLIIGGVGGIGLHLADYILRQGQQARVVLTGRRSEADLQSNTPYLQLVNTYGKSRVSYLTANAASYSDLKSLLIKVVASHHLEGIFHCAGTLNDSFLVNKTVEQFENTLEAKVSGSLHLIQAANDVSQQTETGFDFILFCSSCAGQLGFVGQIDYAAGNGFIDGFSDARNKVGRNGFDRLLSVNWPLWENAGMGVDQQALKELHVEYGLLPLPVDVALNHVNTLLLAADTHHVLVTYGDPVKIDSQYVNAKPQRNLQTPALSQQTAQAASGKGAVTSVETAYDPLVAHLKQLISSVLKLETSKLDTFEPLQSYGLDSFSIMRINQALSEHFSRLSKTLLYEVESIHDLATTLSQLQPDAVQAWLGAVAPAASQQAPQASARQDAQPRPAVPRAVDAQAGDAVAIIGINAQFPGAANIEAFWELLRNGVNAVTEIPESRWSLEDFYATDKIEAIRDGKSYCKQGGFLEQAYDFDEQFFKLSPREILAMDPQERLFMQSCWRALEDSGYTKDKIKQQYDGDVGVYVGITKTGFNLYGPALWNQDERTIPTTSFSSVASRISYLFDLNGPSMPIDTMCSSSLVAIHEAVHSLKAGRCQMAIVGGVNLYLHPASYVQLCASSMLSQKGQCHSFGDQADGFVPGEGVATLILKPLRQAQADGDRIYATIKGSAVNHGGAAKGYTVPNPKAQTAVIEKALNSANITAGELSYIEAHGTGTELGDPIELNALKACFSGNDLPESSCAIGSVKSNIGHLEAAAGLAGVIKVVLQMQHRVLVPSLHAQTINPNLEFDQSPFYLQRELIEWPSRNNRNRIAGVSSFGAAGVNAHVILEEYTAPQEQVVGAPVGQEHVQALVFPFSSNTEQGLKRNCRRFLDFLQAQAPEASTAMDIATFIRATLRGLDNNLSLNQVDDSTPLVDAGLKPFDFYRLFEAVNTRYGLNLSMLNWQGSVSIGRLVAVIQGGASSSTVPALRDVAFTLQTCRNAHQHRVAICARDLAGFIERLQRFLGEEDPQVNGSGLYAGVKTHRFEELSKQRALAHDRVQIAFAHHESDALAQLWVNGSFEQWEGLYSDGLQPKKCRIPEYAFAANTHSFLDKVGSNARAVRHLDQPSEAGKVSAEIISHVPVRLEVPAVAGFIRERLANVLKMDEASINNEVSFVDYGLDSILGVDLIHSLNEQYRLGLKTTCIYDYPNVEDLSRHAHGLITPVTIVDSSTQFARPAPQLLSESPATGQERNQKPIAIIGMSGRFGGADDTEAFWNNIRDGKDSTESVSRWDLADYLNQEKYRDGVCQRGGFLNEIDKFDAIFFNISGVEATYMDPQQRLFLEEAWHALEDSGYAGSRLTPEVKDQFGIYVGGWTGDYNEVFEASEAPAQALWGNMGSMIASRIAYYLDFKGPALTIDTACSSSLVAIHQACKDLRLGITNTAIAGGVFVQTTPRLYVQATQAGMLSPTGTCSPFDENADGFVPGEAVGAIILKRLDDALADGDNIRAVIYGDGINQDGRTNGITAPSAVSQEKLLKRVYKDFGITANDISMVEAHGTGTNLGDPIEFNALCAAFTTDSAHKNYCALGSVKANIGHTQFAAGISSVIKSVLALEHSTIPPLIHHTKGNSRIDLAGSPFYVAKSSQPWQARNGRRLATISAFGASGTNAHVVLGDLPQPVRHTAEKFGPQLILLSANSDPQLVKLLQKLREHLESDATVSLTNIAYTLACGRRHFGKRVAILSRSVSELANALGSLLSAAKPSMQIFTPSDLGQGNAQALLKQAHVYIENGQVNDASFQGSICSLPASPFNSMSFWASSKDKAPAKQASVARPSPPASAPRATATRSKAASKYCEFTLTVDDFFIADHLVMGQKVLPGVMYIELMKRSVCAVYGDKFKNAYQIALNDIAWVQPMVFTDATPRLSIIVEVTERGDNADLKVLSRDKKQLYAQAICDLSSGQQVLAEDQSFSHLKAQGIRFDEIDLSAAGLAQYRKVPAAQCYDLLRRHGITHKTRLQGIKALYFSPSTVIAQLQLPSILANKQSPFSVHPCLADSALQAISILAVAREKAKQTRDQGGVQTRVPFAIDRFQQYREIPLNAWSVGHVLNDGKKEIWTIVIYDAQSNVCAVLDGYRQRILSGVPRLSEA